MKTFLSLTLLILMSSTLVSCSGGKSSIKLEVSHGLLVNSSGFDGGLIISGKNLNNGKTFTKSLASGLSVSLTLDVGNWIFTAIGWDGEPISTGSPKLFAGTPYCGRTTSSITSNNFSVTINITEANCGNQAFAGSFPDTTASPVTLPKLALINNCKTLFPGALNVDGSEIVSSKLATNTTPDNYCESVPDDLKSKARSMRIHAVDKTQDQLIPDIGFYSECIKSDNTVGSKMDPTQVSLPANPYAGYDLRLPMKNVPLIITLFETNNCTKAVARFDFKDGLETQSNEHDHILKQHFASSDSVRLFLPSSDLKRAVSPFAHLLPFFKKGDQTRFPTLMTGVGETYHLFTDDIQKRFVIQRENCNSPTPSNGNLSIVSCNDLGDEIELFVNGSAAGTTNISFSLPSSVHSFNIESGANRARWATNKLIWETIGPNDPNNSKKEFFSEGHDDNEIVYGVLSDARNMLAPNGAGGVIGLSNLSGTFLSNCLNATVDKTISIFNNDRLRYESFRVKVHNSPVSVPTGFTCSNSTFDSNCSVGITYDKRMLIWDHQRDLVNPFMVMEFSCDELVGENETRVQETVGSLTYIDRTRLRWNTTVASTNGYQRLDQSRWVKVLDSSSNIVQEIRSMKKLQKADTGNANNYGIWSFTYGTFFDGSAYDEYFQKIEVASNPATPNNLCVWESTQPWVNTTYEDIFATSNTPVQTLRTQALVGTPADQYQINGTFPQALAGNTTGCSGMPTTAGINGGNLIDSSLPMSISSLNSSFKNKFGTTFYSNP